MNRKAATMGRLISWGFTLGVLTALASLTPSLSTAENRPRSVGGIYPHLAVFNNEGECGIGALVPWAGRLWFLTYPPHKPQGSGDKLYSVDTQLRLTEYPESVGGTHANRMIHAESQQLIIGPYFIDAKGKVRAAELRRMSARLTATARHLTDPANKVYMIGMEKELFEVDVHTLAVKPIYRGGSGPFPGAHGKGGYTAGGRLVVAYNGERGWRFSTDSKFDAPAGCLAMSDLRDPAAPWTVIQRKTFCEVTGPGGIAGQAPGDGRLWATGWDKRSVILMLFQRGQWHEFRLPKASYSHDALHGWYTEWPRIREVAPNFLLMHMHGLFYQFPQTFSATDRSGLRPIANYLRMPVDYCQFEGRLVMARDDASIMENALAGQSNSNLWFGSLADIERFGSPAGWGGPWVDDSVQAKQPSPPFFIGGFRHRVLHLRHGNPASLTVTLEIDSAGDGQWKQFASVPVPPEGYAWQILPDLKGNWLRLRTDQDAARVTGYLHLSNPQRTAEPTLFDALADAARPGNHSEGLIKPPQGDARTVLFAASQCAADGQLCGRGLYELGAELVLRAVDDSPREATMRSKFGVKHPGFFVDAASVVVSGADQRYRLPKAEGVYDKPFASGWPRGTREVVTERSMLNAHGTFYELPRPDAGWLRRIRPIATHHKRIGDFASWRGMLVLSGVRSDAPAGAHCVRSADGKAALWLGDVDDLWKMGPPAGRGGPWRDTAVKAGQPSDPYLMAGYEHKLLEIRHDQSTAIGVTAEVDFLADGTWATYRQFQVPAGATFQHAFPAGYSAHWIRLTARRDARITAEFIYGRQQ